MKYLRKATAATVATGPFLDKADGVTLKTALTTGSTLNGRVVSNGTGAAFTPATFVHDSNGHYLVPLASGDVPTAGRLRLEFSDPATYLPVWEDFTVLEPAVYDSLFGTTALSTYAGGAVASVASPVTAGTVTDKSGYSLSVPAPAAAAIATAVWSDLLSNASDFNVASSIGALLKTMTAAPTASAVATQVWQDLTAGSDFTSVNSIGAALVQAIANVATINTNMSAFAGLFISGTVSGTPSATNVTVVVANSADSAMMPGLYLNFVSSNSRAPGKLPIVTATAVDGTHVALTFSNPGFGVIPQAGDAVLIG